MLKTDVGPIVSTYGSAVATLSFTPLSDRAARVVRISIDAISATDTWTFSVAGREVGRIRIDSLGNQQLLGAKSSATPKVNDLFGWVRDVLGYPLTYPVPLGQTFTVASIGGATADIAILYSEYDATDLSSMELNHPEGKHFLAPLYLVPKTNVTHTSGVAEDDFSAQYLISLAPNLYGTIQIPQGYVITLLALWMEGAGRNTYNGSADHQSVTDHLAVLYKGTRYYTRAGAGGLQNIGSASAAGSANTVYGDDQSAYPAFQLTQVQSEALLPAPLVLRGGDTIEFLFGTSGDSTGGADYSHAYVVFLADIQLTG